jgi:hypothetical protein
MAVEVHVTGRIETGRFSEFTQAMNRWAQYRAEIGDAGAHVLQGLSGKMNNVRIVFTYADLAVYEREEARDALDADYAKVAGAMPFVEGTIQYEIYRVLEEPHAL